MNRLRKAAFAALVVVCALVSTPALQAEGANPTPGGLTVFDAGGWVRGWLAWLGGLFQWGEGAPPAGASGDGHGCADPWGNPACKP
ncbi:MAG: hypothetical protein ACREN5_15560 [Gemmatimonadales bacterium]